MKYLLVNDKEYEPATILEEYFMRKIIQVYDMRLKVSNEARHRKLNSFYYLLYFVRLFLRKKTNAAEDFSDPLSINNQFNKNTGILFRYFMYS